MTSYDIGESYLYGASTITRPFSLDEARWISAHEFGHTLGVSEAPLGLGMDVMMWSGTFGNPVTSADLDLALKAHRTNQWQRWR